MDISAGSSAASVYRADEEKMQDCFDEVTDEVETIFPGSIIKKRGYTIKWVELPQKNML